MSAADTQRYLSLVQHHFEILQLLHVASNARQPRLDVSGLSGWKATLVFYMACIYLKALGRLRGREIQDHVATKEWINSEPDLLRIARPCRKIEERSRDARYEGRSFDRAELIQIARWFREVRDAVVPLLAIGGMKNPPSLDPTPFL